MIHANGDRESLKYPLSSFKTVNYRRTEFEDLGWNRLGLHPSEMMEVLKDREVWRLKFRAAASATLTKKREIKKEEKGLVYINFFEILLQNHGQFLEKWCHLSIMS